MRRRRYLTSQEAARELGVGVSTLQLWAARGLVTPAWRTPGGHARWKLADLERQLDTPRRESMPVAAAIVTSKHGVLAERRHDGRPLWTFPAGEIEGEEQPEDTAIRETKEECGVQIVISHMIGERDHPKTGVHMYYLAARLAPYQDTEIHNGDENELAEVRWLSLAEAEELLVGMFGPVHDHLRQVLG